jgi:hypothetical protein
MICSLDLRQSTRYLGKEHPPEDDRVPTGMLYSSSHKVDLEPLLKVLHFSIGLPWSKSRLRTLDNRHHQHTMERCKAERESRAERAQAIDRLFFRSSGIKNKPRSECVRSSFLAGPFAQLQCDMAGSSSLDPVPWFLPLLIPSPRKLIRCGPTAHALGIGESWRIQAKKPVEENTEEEEP